MQGSKATVLVLHTHHSIMDGSSLQIAIQDLEAMYEALTRGQPAQLPQPPLQYSDFAQWQHSQQQSGAWDRHLR